MSRRRLPGRSTRAVSSVTRWHYLRRGVRQPGSALSAASSATARRLRPLAASWHSNKFLNAARAGAVLLDPSERLQDHEPDRARPDSRPRARGVAHRLRPSPSTGCRRRADEIPADGGDARRGGRRLRHIGSGTQRRRANAPWPMIVLRTPKGWTGPKEVDGEPTEGSWRSHQVPWPRCAPTRST